MKKILLLVFCMLLVSSMAFAQTKHGLFVSSGKPRLAPTLESVFDTLPFNLNGDTLYSPKTGSFDVGVGMDLISFKGFLNIRAEAAGSVNDALGFVGVGPMINVPALVNLIPGAAWVPGLLNPSIGVVVGGNFGGNSGKTGADYRIVLSILNVQF